MSLLINGRFVSTEDLIKKLKDKEISSIHSEYKYGVVKHKFTSNPFNKGDPRKINDAEVDYKLNMISYFFMKEKITPEIYNLLTEATVLNHDTSAGYYFSHGARSEYKKITDIFAKTLINQENSEYDNSAYIKELFNSESFYRSTHDSSLFTFKQSDKDNYRNIDFGKYAFFSGNKLALNHIYEEIKVLKKTYQEFVFDSLSINQFAVALEHYKNKNNEWPNRKDEKIKSIDNIFYNIDFITLFACEKGLNKNQSRILEFVLKDKKLVKKLEDNAGKKNIYTKDKYTQLESKDVFVLAVLNKNSDFINILLKSGYEINSHETGLIYASDFSNKIISLPSENIDNLPVVTQKIIKFASGYSFDLNFIYSLSEEDINSLKKNYVEFKHDISFRKIANDKNNKPIDLYNSKKCNITDLLILKEPYSLPFLYKQGLEDVHPKVAEIAIQKILTKVNNSVSVKSIEDSIDFLKNYLNKQDDSGKKLIQMTFDNMDMSDSILNPFFDNFIADKVKELNIDNQEKEYYSTSSLALFSQLSETEKTNIPEDATNLFIKNSIATITSLFEDKHEDDEELIDLLKSFVIAPLAQLSIHHKEVFDVIKNSAPDYDQNMFSHLLTQIEKKHLELLAGDFSREELSSKNQRRL